MFEEEIKELGLTDNEARIYLSLLKSGPTNPSEISHNLGLHRGYTYDALDRLKEKGIVNSVLIKNKIHFQANSPEELKELLKLKLEKFEKLLPKLNEIKSSEKKDTRVELHTGRHVYRTLLKDIIANIKTNKEIKIIGVDEEVLTKEVEPIYLEQYLNTIKSKKVKEKVIIKKGTKKLGFPLITYKEIDPGVIGNTAQIIYQDKVAIFILSSPYHLIIIKNEEVAKTYKKQFELLWQVAK